MSRKRVTRNTGCTYKISVTFDDENIIGMVFDDKRPQVSESIILALRDAGVKYISTRSIGCNHIDIKAAGRIGISIGTVAYSPDSVADYTLMLMAARNAKITKVRSILPVTIWIRILLFPWKAAGLKYIAWNGGIMY